MEQRRAGGQVGWERYRRYSMAVQAVQFGGTGQMQDMGSTVWGFEYWCMIAATLVDRWALGAVLAVSLGSACWQCTITLPLGLSRSCPHQTVRLRPHLVPPRCARCSAPGTINMPACNTQHLAHMPSHPTDRLLAGASQVPAALRPRRPRVPPARGPGC